MIVPIALVAASSLLLLLSIWILIPPPIGLVLPLAVAAPELSPLLLVAGLVLWGISARRASVDRAARAALVMAMVSTLHALVPLVQLPFAVRRFDAAIAATSGPPLAAPRDVRTIRGVPFSKVDGVPLALDIYRPDSTGTGPVVLQIYGGSWQTGSPTDDEWFARHFAARGYVVFAMDYRHAPEWRWPEQIVDARTALWWIGEQSPKYGGDPTRIILVGRSAGAQLAMRLAYQEGPSSIRGVVNLYGPTDLADGWRNPPRPDPLGVRDLLEALIGGTPDQKPEHYRHASPITWVSRSSAPTLTLHGSRDHIVDAKFGRALDTALRQAGATSVLLELPWSEHAFDKVPNGLGRHLTLRYAERFIAWAANR